jgi:hypothetical protein
LQRKKVKLAEPEDQIPTLDKLKTMSKEELLDYIMNKTANFEYIPYSRIDENHVESVFTDGKHIFTRDRDGDFTVQDEYTAVYKEGILKHYQGYIYDEDIQKLENAQKHGGRERQKKDMAENTAL